MIRTCPLAIGAAIVLAIVSCPTARAQGPLLKQVCGERNSFLHFTVNDGHLAMRCNQNTDWQRNAPSGSSKEMFKIENGNGQGKLRYQWTTGDESLSLDLTAFGETLRLKREPRGKSKLVPAEFSQAVDGTVTFAVGAGDKRQTFQARSLWRLAIAQPSECQEHLFPLVATLRNRWKLADTAARIEASLLQGAAEGMCAQRARFAALVEQLGDEQFAKRETADRALRAGGMVALSFLRQLDPNRLDAEQQFRLRRIIEALTGHDEDDTVTVAAASLAGDPTVWIDLLGRPERATRQAAARQLIALLGCPIDIDPAAEPNTQKEKREKLRKPIEK
jgi:hypothetical protein